MATILITGCDRGLGLALAHYYAEAGDDVIATCLSPEAAKDLGSIAGSVRILPLDITRHEAVEALAKDLSGTAIDILVNNAALVRPHYSFGSIDYEHWRKTLEVNVLGTTKMAESFVEHVAASKRKIMVFLTSQMGSISLNNSGSSYCYRSSKAALNMIIKSLAIDLAPRRICVLGIHPGLVGPGTGPVSSADSAAGMGGVINRAGFFQSGTFVSYQGHHIPW